MRGFRIFVSSVFFVTCFHVIYLQRGHSQSLATLQAPIAAGQPTGQVLDAEAPAPSLEGNLVGTPTTQPLKIYLPPGYQEGTRRYPVIYLLHGHSGHPGDFFNAAALDALIGSGKVPPLIVVMPSGENVYGGGFYRDSPVTGHWGDYIAKDLVNFVDAHYRTLARPGGRAVVGFSMGGYGAIYMGMEKPGVFSVVYAQSPCCLAPIEELGLGNEVWKRLLTMNESDVRNLLAQRDYTAAGVFGLLSAMATTVSPTPLHVSFPFHVVDGDRIPDQAFDRYAAQFPINRIEQARSALLALRAFVFENGIHDQNAHIRIGTGEFSCRLTEAGVPHRYETFDGSHYDHTQERLTAVVIPYVASKLDPPE